MAENTWWETIELKGDELLAAEFESAFPSLQAAISAQNHNLGN